jgi:hypothetical protein
MADKHGKKLPGTGLTEGQQEQEMNFNDQLADLRL